MEVPRRRIYKTGGWWEFTEKEAMFHCISCGSPHEFMLDEIKAVLIGDIIKCPNHIEEHDWEQITPDNIFLNEDRPCHECLMKVEESLPAR